MTILRFSRGRPGLRASQLTVVVAISVATVLSVGCNRHRPGTTDTPPEPRVPVENDETSPNASAPEPLPPSSTTNATASSPQEPAATPPVPRCKPADWSKRSLPPLLEPGKRTNPSWRDQSPVEVPGSHPFYLTCSDSPSAAREPPAKVTDVVEGVEIRLTDAAPAGTSGRGWNGNQCSFELRLADGSGNPVALGPEQVAPFTNITSFARSGSAAWVELSFNGYTREFPQGGNRVIAVDLCDGRVVWRSDDGVANGGLLLVDDYLISAFGFTNERRAVFVFDAYTGEVVQKLRILENICPSKSWAPHWDGGRCDAPGQLVGAARSPRIEDGLFLVDTNTGSSAFTIIR